MLKKKTTSKPVKAMSPSFDIANDVIDFDSTLNSPLFGLFCENFFFFKFNTNKEFYFQK
jgi:hypothetical protein